MKRRKPEEMKYLPQMAISWEAFFTFTLCCFTLGAGACAFALRYVKEKKDSDEGCVTIEFKSAAGEGESAKARLLPGEEKNTPPPTIGELAEELWLRKKLETPGPLLSDSRPSDTPGFTNAKTESFWKEEILPHRRLFTHLNELAVIEKVLLVLDREGLCSSVVAGDGKSVFNPTARRFSKVTLLDHSLRVALRIKEIHDSAYTEKILYGKHLIAALAHDIGKIERFRSRSDYVKDDHAAASARALRGWIIECAGEKRADEFRHALDAVRNHHRRADENEGISRNLKKADVAAREEEFSGENKKSRAARSISAEKTSERGKAPEWLCQSIGRILNDRIEPAINIPVLEKEPFVVALSATNGIVYLDPHYLLERVREHMETERIADLLFFDPSRSAELEAKLTVTNALKARGWVEEVVKDGYYAAFWNYTYKGKKAKKGGFWIPVLAEAFGTGLAEFEKRKNQDMRQITSIKPCVMRGRKK